MVKKQKELFQCKKCEWSTETASYMQGHMTKHTVGQYHCVDCKRTFVTKDELREHSSSEHTSSIVNSAQNIQCNECDKQFSSEHSLSQHKTSKHGNVRNIYLPIGHPDRAKTKDDKVLNIACTFCDKRFANGKDVDDHMKEHIENTEQSTKNTFTEARISKECRYFRMGACIKGNACRFMHIKRLARNQVPEQAHCNRGPECIFYLQKRCKFFHPRISVENSHRRQNIEKECRYGGDCWKQTCPFIHPDQVFQYTNNSNKPPIRSTQMNAWMDY